MRGKDLLESIEFIDDALVEEALNPSVSVRRTHANTVVRWGMAAACVIVIGVSATAWLAHLSIIGGKGGMSSAPAMDGASADSAGGAEAGNAVPEAAADSELPDGGMQDATADSEGAVAEQNEGIGDFKQEAGAQKSAKADYTIISDYYGEKYAEIDYKMPEKGEVIRFHYLNETIKYYTEQENTIETLDNSVYAYEVVIELFGDVIADDAGTYYGVLASVGGEANTQIEQEYRRLVELGYAVKLSEDFRLTGLFTKVEMDTFQASPEYGYVFRFENE